MMCLPSMSKIYERILENQLKLFPRCFLSSFLQGFRKNYFTQHALLRYIECIQRALDRGENAGAVFMELSKEFDCLNHYLLLAKLGAYGFGKGALTLIHSYSNGKKQKVKANGPLGSWRAATQGVPQGSVLRTLLLNIYINHLLMTNDDVEVCSYGDDTT